MNLSTNYNFTDIYFVFGNTYLSFPSVQTHLSKTLVEIDLNLMLEAFKNSAAELRELSVFRGSHQFHVMDM